jgi:hypothetical protein
VCIGIQMCIGCVADVASSNSVKAVYLGIGFRKKMGGVFGEQGEDASTT